MKLAAITGSIGCGKTTLSKIVRRLGYVVYDIDGWVRRLYYQKDFIKVIAAHFPEVMEGEKVNKRKLRNLVFGDNARLKVLESLIHPFLKQTLMSVRRRNARRADLFFMDVALLFEMGWDKYCDYIVVADVDYETSTMMPIPRLSARPMRKRSLLNFMTIPAATATDCSRNSKPLWRTTAMLNLRSSR